MQGKQYLAYEERFIESESRAVEAQKEAKIARYIAIASLSLSVLQFLINDLIPLLK